MKNAKPEGFQRARRAFCIAAGATLLLFSAPADAATMKGPAAFVQALADNVLGVIRDPAKSPSERRAALRGIFLDSFDAGRIGRFVIGRYWRTASEAQRDEYEKLFPDYVAEIYARQFATHNGETFVVVRENPMDEKQSVVWAEIRRPRTPPIKVSFRVQRGGGGYRVVDVTIEGASLIVTKRSEFASLIRRKGFDELLARMRRVVGHPTDRMARVPPAQR